MKRETKAGLWLTVTTIVVIIILCFLMGCKSRSGNLKPIERDEWIGFRSIQHKDSTEHYYVKGDSVRVIVTINLGTGIATVSRDYRYKVK